MEIWDAYNQNGEKIEKDLIRGEQIPNELFHIVSEIIVRHTDGSYLAMQRDFSKPNYPGLFEITAGGSALKGETPLKCAVRELYEETGLKSSEFSFLYSIVSDKSQVIYYGYYCVVDCEKTSVKLQQGETISYKWIDESQVVDFINSAVYVSVHGKRILQYLKNQI